MSQDRRSRPSLYSQIDVAHGALAAATSSGGGDGNEVVLLLREILAAQDRQNEFLEEMVNHFCTTQRQRASELGNWKQANPGLARSCRMASEALSKVQTEYLVSLTQEISELHV